MTQEKVIVGVDVGKAKLDVYIAPSGDVRQFANDAPGRRGLRKLLNSVSVEFVILEATGRYHRAVHLCLDDAGIPVAVISPLQARRFAQALGQCAKTDPIDAALLARFGQVLCPEATPPRRGAQFRLSDLARGRGQLVRAKTALVNSIREYTTADVVAAFKLQIDCLNREIRKLDAAMRAVIADDPEYARRDRILRSIPGIGPISAAILCAEMPELGTLGRRQVASLLGVAPFPDDSGKRTGQRYIKGGRATPRTVLFMAATTAIRYNRDMKQVYDRLTGQGKKHKVAVTAVMRKMIVLANVLLRDDRLWSATAPVPVAA